MLNNYVKLHVNPALWDKDAAHVPSIKRKSPPQTQQNKKERKKSSMNNEQWEIQHRIVFPRKIVFHKRETVSLY